MIKPKTTNKGLIKAIVVIIIALLILSYFGFNLRELASSPTTQDNFHYALNFVIDGWNNYLKGPVTYLWNEIFLKLIWTPALQILQSKAVKAETSFFSLLS